MRTCENEGSGVGNKPCPKEATHRILIAHEGDDYESFLCPECFTGFREEMIKQGLRPKNEVGNALVECEHGYDACPRCDAAELVQSASEEEK